ncbi:unnamed protein product, partial [Mesorhabditis spiculigera]
MNEQAGSGTKGRNERRGFGAQASSGRREFRRFRGTGKKPNAGTARPTPPYQKQNSSSEMEGNMGTSEQGEVLLEQDTVVQSSVPKPPKKRPCRFFRSRQGCAKGDECQFKHTLPKEKLPLEIEAAPEVPDTGSILRQAAVEVIPRKTQAFVPMRFCVGLKDNGSEDAKKIRNAEINYYKRRYPRGKVDEQEGTTIIQFIFEPTDPAWTFAIKKIHLSLGIPAGFPFEKVFAAVDRGENPEMPDILCAYVEEALTKNIEERFARMEAADEYEGLAKVLLKWLDTHLFTLFLEGLRRTKLVLDASAAGISLVLNKKQEQTAPVEETENLRIDEYSEDEEESSDEDSDGRDDDGIGEEEGPSEDLAPIDTDQQMDRLPKLPIEVVLAWSDASKNIASICAVSMQLMVRCTRCAEHNDLDVSVRDSAVFGRCKRCNNAYSVRLRGELVHENSNLLAQCDSRACRPIDFILPNSRLKFVCFACNKEDDVQKIGFGQPHKSWCRSCHTSCAFTISAIRFQGDFSRTIGKDEQASKALPVAKKKLEKGVGIVAGQPLPNLGACVHYKKSYRWFRFPCCGKVYPCDDCHGEKEKDHEMKLANRMICGHCSAEQPFVKSKPCSNCQQMVTRSKSQFWEGGKGCRDQNKMNRNDARKHVNSRQKTVSKKKVGDLVVKKKP